MKMFKINVTEVLEKKYTVLIKAPCNVTKEDIEKKCSEMEQNTECFSQLIENLKLLYKTNTLNEGPITGRIEIDETHEL